VDKLIRGISYCLAGKYSLLQKNLKMAGSTYFMSLLEDNKHNPKYLFNTVAKLTKEYNISRCRHYPAAQQ